MRNKKIFFIVISIIIAGFSVTYFMMWKSNNSKSVSKDTFILGEDTDNTLNTDDSNSTKGSMETGIKEVEKPLSIYVYVCGNVAKPGVYVLYQGDRMYKAIEMAGGITDAGCIDYLEMASELVDGQRVYVPDFEEALTLQENNTNESGGLINLNKASMEELMTLPGIGESKAKAIISYREKQPFNAIEDIMNISGIKEAAFSKISQYICV